MRSYRGRCHSRMTGSAKLVVDMVKSIFLLFLIWRLLLFIPLLAGYQFLSYRPDADYTNIWKFIEPYSPVDHFLLCDSGASSNFGSARPGAKSEAVRSLLLAEASSGSRN